MASPFSIRGVGGGRAPNLGFGSGGGTTLANLSQFGGFGGGTGATGTTTSGVATPQRGVSAFGAVPGPVGVPESTWSQTNRAVPGFGNLTGGASGVVGSELAGTLSPQTIGALRNASAQFGVATGMPGSGLAWNNLMGNIAGFTENRQRQGVQDYLGLTAGVGAQQTNPALAAQIAERNAEMAAAPDPEMAYQQMMKDWLMKYNLTKNAVQNPSTGTSDWQNQGILSGPERAALALSGGGSALPSFGSSGYTTPASFNRFASDSMVNPPVLYGPGGGPNTGGGMGTFLPSQGTQSAGYNSDMDWSNPYNLNQIEEEGY